MEGTVRWINDLATSTKLFAVFGLLSLVGAFVAVAGLAGLASFNAQLSDLQASVLALYATQQAQSDLVREQLAVKDALLSDEVSDWAEVYRWDGQFAGFLSSPTLYAGDEQDVQALDELDALYERYDAALEPIYASTYREDYDPQAALLGVREQADPVAGDMQARLAGLAARYATRAAAQAESIDAAFQAQAGRAMWTLLALIGLLIVAVAITGQITQPLHSLTSAIIAFQHNTYRSEMLAPFVRRRDELGRLACAVDSMATSITESNRLKDRFLESASRFVPVQYLEFLEKPAITDVSLGDHVSAEMAVMFSDMRGFTTASEKMTPQENFDFVNEYLRLVSPVIQKHDGFIVKFLGDGMMAIFPYGVDDAVRAGIEKQEKVQAFNALLAARGFQPVSVGVGIHTGHMMVGMIGEERRMQGDAFSDNVNLTSRVEGLNKFYGTSMIVSEDTVRCLQNPAAYRMRYLGRARVKGREAPLGLYEVYEGLPAEVVARREATRADFERGIALYTAGRLDEARQAFQAVVAADADDRAAGYYLDRCFEWAERGPTSGWDGALVMADK